MMWFFSLFGKLSIGSTPKGTSHCGLWQSDSVISSYLSLLALVIWSTSWVGNGIYRQNNRMWWMDVCTAQVRNSRVPAPGSASGSLSAKSHGSSKGWQHHALSWFLAGTGPSTMDSTTTYPCMIHPCRERTHWWMLKSIKQIWFYLQIYMYVPCVCVHAKKVLPPIRFKCRYLYYRSTLS